jgi:hypothetical protein
MSTINEENESSIFDLYVSENISSSFSKAIVWARVMAFFILGIAVLAVMTMLFAGSGRWTFFDRIYDEMASLVYIIIFVALAIAGIFTWLLFNFCIKTKRGTDDQDNEVLEEGFNSLKIYMMLSAVLGALILISSIGTIIQSFLMKTYGR